VYKTLDRKPERKRLLGAYGSIKSCNFLICDGLHVKFPVVKQLGWKADHSNPRWLKIRGVYLHSPI
jgi:hypothetical protein